MASLTCPLLPHLTRPLLPYLTRPLLPHLCRLRGALVPSDHTDLDVTTGYMCVRGDGMSVVFIMPQYKVAKYLLVEMVLFVCLRILFS